MLKAFWLIAATCCSTVVAQEQRGDLLEQITRTAAEARAAAAAQPEIVDAGSPPVKAYLAEQQRQRLVRLAGLRQRIKEYQLDSAKEGQVPVLKQQLAELEIKPLEPLSFDAAYGYQPASGLVGYCKRVRLLENAADGKSIIMVDDTALVIEGLATSEYPSGKFFGIEQAILIGSPLADYIFRGSPKKQYEARLVDLESILQTATEKNSKKPR